MKAYHGHQADKEHDGGEQHDAESNDHQGLTAGLLNQDQAYEGHANVDNAHAESGL